MSEPLIVAAEPRYQVSTFQHWDFELGQRLTQTIPGMWNLNGVLRCDHEPPSWFHRHWAQTVGVVDDEVWRCPCGAFGGPGQPWVHLHWREIRRRKPRWIGSRCDG